MPGKAFEISGLSIRADNHDGRADGPTAFNANMSPIEFQSARDVTIKGTSIDVFDESGAVHTVTMVFTHSGTPGKWLWELQTANGEQIIGGNRGTMSFAEDGSPTSFTFDDGSSSFRFNPMNGSANLSINLDVGKYGSTTGVTQFRSATTTAAKYQDGYPMGKLTEITISEQGNVEGLFSNGQSRTLATILLAEFQNPAGLYRSGDTMWTVSNNSGEGVLHRPGEGTESSIKPGALEMSNVDLASEFTDLITTQRGYQANARVITTSDSLLQELVQLVR
jgi:flagellar hook protein FlgE